MNDFGFITMDESELKDSEAIESAETKLQSLFDAINPLLQNLKANPENEIIKWPNRLSSIEDFENKLKDIMER